MPISLGRESESFFILQSGMSGPPENGWNLIKPTVIDRTLPTVKFPSHKGNLADFVEML